MVQFIMFRKIAFSVCFLLFLGTVSACSPSELLRSKSDESSPANTQTKPGEIGKPVALPPRFGSEPPKPGQAGTPTTGNGMPALSPKGVNVDTLFSENIRGTDERFERVENAVIDLRREFENYKPAIVRLSAVEEDIQDLIKELEVLLEEPPPAPNNTANLEIEQLDPRPTGAPLGLEPEQPRTATPPKHPPAPAITKPEKQHYDGIVGVGLRIADHKDKTRIVIDTNKNTPFKIDLDNNEKILIVELPEARWIGKKSEKFTKSSILDTLEVEDLNGKGTLIILTLKKSTQIKQQNRLPADQDTPYHRIYFDLKL